MRRSAPLAEQRLISLSGKTFEGRDDLTQPWAVRSHFSRLCQEMIHFSPISTPRSFAREVLQLGSFGFDYATYDILIYGKRLKFLLAENRQTSPALRDRGFISSEVELTSRRLKKCRRFALRRQTLCI